jgi:para-nitrobenzyl esterase
LQASGAENLLPGPPALFATALAGAAVLSAPALAANGGIPGPNPGQIKKANGPTVNTADGPVRGFVENGVNKFLGIPYAAPPVGALRWMPPAPPEHHALLDATEFANTCPQVPTIGPFAGPPSVTEDCLYLKDQVVAKWLWLPCSILSLAINAECVTTWDGPD